MAVDLNRHWQGVVHNLVPLSLCTASSGSFIPSGMATMALVHMPRHTLGARLCSRKDTWSCCLPLHTRHNQPGRTRALLMASHLGWPPRATSSLEVPTRMPVWLGWQWRQHIDLVAVEAMMTMMMSSPNALDSQSWNGEGPGLHGGVLYTSSTYRAFLMASHKCWPPRVTRSSEVPARLPAWLDWQWRQHIDLMAVEAKHGKSVCELHLATDR